MTERERIEEVRKFLKLKKKEFAELLGYAYSQNYTNYLNGSSNLSIKMLRAIKDHIPNINADWILSGQGTMFLNSNTSTSNNQKIINRDGHISHIANNSHNNNKINIPDTQDIESLKREIKSLNKIIKSQESQLNDKDEIIKLLKINR
ncbi:hypothetical protein [Aureispira sp. CCB-QB1]|uniref:hypothetical protein n=1 Tax=Aureispira sp. CCB-QB1 TaxID=1313421 RepID=UPI00069688CD|nr:hypothetical protein [Aureispira sp. CCB-QB1]